MVMRRRTIILFVTATIISSCHHLSSNLNLPVVQASMDPRVVGGTEVFPEDKYPFMAALYEVNGSRKFRCGGSLIGRNVVLSAGHCYDFVDYVEIGRYDLGASDFNEEHMEGFNVQLKVLHPDYDEDTLESDVMLILLDGATVYGTPVTLDSGNGEVNFNEVDENGSGKDLIVMGYGDTEFGGDISEVLLEVEVDYVDNTECNEAYESKEYSITSNMLCAYRDGKDACQGDSGGPLITADGKNIQVGIVSFGEECAKKNFPGVYASVSSHYEWIQSYVKEWESLLTGKPSPSPSIFPSIGPSFSMTNIPTRYPTLTNTIHLSQNPSLSPDISTTSSPSISQTRQPTINATTQTPSLTSTIVTSQNPSLSPITSTSSPSISHTRQPTVNEPTQSWTVRPSIFPTLLPSTVHTTTSLSPIDPSLSPTSGFSTSPSSAEPTLSFKPTKLEVERSTIKPSLQSSRIPSAAPINRETSGPSGDNITVTSSAFYIKTISSFIVACGVVFCFYAL